MVSPYLWICNKLVCKVTAPHGLITGKGRPGGLFLHLWSPVAKDSHRVTSPELENTQTGTPLAGRGPEGGARQWQASPWLPMFGAAAAWGAGTARGGQRVGKRVPDVPGRTASVPHFLAFSPFVPAPPRSLLA